MKKLISIYTILLILLAQSVFAQPEQPRKEKERTFIPKIERHTKVFSQVRALSDLKFEEPKLLQLNYQHIMYRNGHTQTEDWSDSFRDVYIFDGEYVSEIQFEFYDPNEDQWNLSSKDLITYENGLITEYILQYIDYNTDELVNNRKTEYNYIFLNGRYLFDTLTLSNWNIETLAWDFDFRANVIFDEVGITGVNFHDYDYVNDDWELVERSIFEQSGNHIVELMEKREGDSFINDQRITYMNTQRSELFDILTSEMNAFHLGSNLLSNYMYRTPDMLEEVWDGEAWQLDYRITYSEYESNQKNAKSVYFLDYLVEEYYDGEWEDHYLITYEITDGNVSMATEYFVHQGDAIPDFREEFSHDNRGLMTWIYSGHSDGDSGFFLDDRVFLTWSGTDVSVPSDTQLPIDVQLGNAYPNPFNPTVNLPFEISQPTHVRIEIFDVTGRIVAKILDSNLNSGAHTVQFDAQLLSSGIYFVRLNAGNQTKNTRITLVK